MVSVHKKNKPPDEVSLVSVNERVRDSGLHMITA